MAERLLGRRIPFGFLQAVQDGECWEVISRAPRFALLFAQGRLLRILRT